MGYGLKNIISSNYGNDANNFPGNTIAYCTSGVINAAGYASVILTFHHGSNSGTYVQFSVSVTGSRFDYRTKTGGTWYNWKQITTS